MHTTLAGLEVEVLQANGGPPTGAVVLCHGFGAPGDDLVGLHGELVELCPKLASVRFFFPAAPLELEGGFGDSRAWWMIDFATIGRLQAGDPEALRDFRKLEPPGMGLARKKLLALIDEAQRGSKLPTSRLLLGGFSQGAMLATDVALRLEEAPLGLCVLSGTLLIEDVWAQKAKARAGLPVFQSHGRQDPVLAYQAAVWLEELLVKAGLSVDFAPFDGGHTIPSDVLRRLAAFLDKRF